MKTSARGGARARVVLGRGKRAGAARGAARVARRVPFSAETVTDPGTGWAIVVLRYQERAGAGRLEARLCPHAGGNLFSWKRGDDELLHQPETLADLALHRSGTPVLFPTPNRVRDSRMAFEGRAFTFPPNSQNNFIHGLVRGRPWQVGTPRASAAGVAVDLFVDWDPAQPEFERFPIEHRLTVTYTLRKQGLRIAYAVENRAQTRLPFGFGLHPFFRAPEARADVLLHVPVARRMEAVERLPTGKLLPVAGTTFDLRKPTSLEALDLDDVFFGAGPAKPPAFIRRDLGLRVTLGGSKEFTHAVVYTPPGRPFFCVENQTCSTDAHNLFARGLAKESHLMVVAPGKTARGQVEWTLRPEKSARSRR